MNIFMVREGVLITPPITDNILEGITRRSIIDLAKNELCLTTLERSIDRTEVYLCEELFMTGTAVQLPIDRWGMARWDRSQRSCASCSTR